MAQLSKLPIEVRHLIFDYAIEINAKEPNHPWEPFKTAITSYKSLLLVDHKTNRIVKNLYTKDRVINITVFAKDIPTLYRLYQASKQVRILRDANFRFCHKFYTDGAPNSRDEDLQTEDKESFMSSCSIQHFGEDSDRELQVAHTPTEVRWRLRRQGYRLRSKRTCCSEVRRVTSLEWPAISNSLKFVKYNWFRIAERDFGRAFLLVGAFKDLTIDLNKLPSVRYRA